MMPTARIDQSRGFFVFLQAAAKLICASTDNC